MGFSLSDLDPTSSSSAIRQGLRYLDPTYSGSGIRQYWRWVDENVAFPGEDIMSDESEVAAGTEAQALADANPDEFDALIRESMYAQYSTPNERQGLGGTFRSGSRGLSARYTDAAYQRYTGASRPRAELTATTRGLSGGYWSR